MILQTGFRTDIPAFYSEWFANRLRAGYGSVAFLWAVLVRHHHTLWA